MVDGIGRNINYLRLSITDRCNLRCKYCMPEEGIPLKTHQDVLSFEEIDTIVEGFVGMGITKIRVTGGEPLIRKDIISLLNRIGRHPEVKDFAMTTNGIFLKKMAASIKEAGINRVNISLDSLNPDKFSLMTRGGSLEDVLDGIQEAIKVGLTPIKINVVLIGGFNDDEIEDFVELTKNNPIDVRFIELMPIGEVARWSLDNFISNQNVLDKVKALKPIESEDKSSPATYYKLPGAQGKVGLISPISCKFCSDCNRIRLTSEGMLKYCLHSDVELNLKELVDSKKDFESAINTFINTKPKEHNLENGEFVNRNMVRIGG